MDNCLLEVHSVKVFINKSEGASNEIYGRILLDDFGVGDVDIFDVDKHHAKSISADGMLPLSGPSRCIRGYTCVIGVSLKEKYSDLEVSFGYLSFEGSRPPVIYDTPVSFAIRGEHGYAMFHVTLFKYAKQVVVELDFVPKGVRPQYTIFGQVSAEYSAIDTYTGKYSRKYYQTRLFDLTEEHAMTFDGAQAVKIPLLRSVVAAPADEWLVIHADLWFNDSGISFPFQPMSGMAVLFPESNDWAYIDRNLGRIMVRVKWTDGVKNKHMANLK